MIRFSAIRKFKCPLALCVIVSFALVFGCDLLCDLGIISFSSTTPTVVTTISHNHENEQGHHESSATGHDHNSHSHSGDKHDHGNEAEDCCDDITQQFYSSLVSSSGASLGSLIHAEAFKLISTFTLTGIFKVESFKGLQVVSTYDHHSNGPPGGRIRQRICILFCTFLI
ncbi:MAG: hypothetical protein HWD62_07040 [Cyclobacteriaceae bacterium]|jgi:hypothetical protein|nr:MAG: hypothetical protein HWD62_07040 [Cyclobacteriaceae bacterium]